MTEEKNREDNDHLPFGSLKQEKTEVWKAFFHIVSTSYLSISSWTFSSIFEPKDVKLLMVTNTSIIPQWPMTCSGRREHSPCRFQYWSVERRQRKKWRWEKCGNAPKETFYKVTLCRSRFTIIQNILWLKLVRFGRSQSIESPSGKKLVKNPNRLSLPKTPETETVRWGEKNDNIDDDVNVGSVIIIDI